MNGLGVLGQVILFERTPFVSEILQDGEIPTYPEHIGIFQVCLRVPLLGMDEIWELCRILYEKDGGVIEYPIEVSFFSLNLDRKSLRP